jgi:transposase-like protein
MAESRYERFRERFSLEFVRRLAEEGFSDEEIAMRCGLELTVLRQWRKKHTDFDEAIRLGRSESDYSVIRALYKKATGFNVGLKKTYKLKRIDFDPETGKKLREYEELATGIDETFVPADLSAEKFWLKNRQSERWHEQADKGASDDENESGILEIPVADMLDEPQED